MKILIACEFSGIVREAFRKRGHHAMSCDLLPTEKQGKHYQGDVMDIIGDGWDMMIAHPPCTYLSIAATRVMYPGGILNQDRYKKGLIAKSFFMKLYNSNIKTICIENPVQFKVYNIPKYNQIIQPYYFGDPYTKKTCLWLKGLNPLEYKIPDIKPESTKRAEWYNKGGKERQKNRAKTFPGIAKAMAEQWG